MFGWSARLYAQPSGSENVLVPIASFVVKEFLKRKVQDRRRYLHGDLFREMRFAFRRVVEPKMANILWWHATNLVQFCWNSDCMIALISLSVVPLPVTWLLRLVVGAACFFVVFVGHNCVALIALDLLSISRYWHLSSRAGWLTCPVACWDAHCGGFSRQ